MSHTTMLFDLAANALVGTERRKPELPAATGRIGVLLAGLDQEDDASRLLAAAGIVSLYQRSGRLPATTTDPPPPRAPDETIPCCTPRGALYLGLLLQGEHIDLLPEWLELTAHTGGRIPEEYLPSVLDRGARDRDLQRALLPVLGERGRWLAQFNPAWEYATSNVDESEWAEGTRIGRMELLRWLRSVDPDRGRRLLESTWSEETAEDRAAFVGNLATGLSMNDEAFLDAALDDRRAEVRTSAVRLLLRLADSRLVKRAEAVAAHGSSIREKRKSPGLPHGRELVVEPPEECTAAMIRDGIDRRAQYGLGEGASWLMEIVERVGLDYWTTTFSATPDELVGLASASQWRDSLIAGWTRASVHQRNASWAGALLDASHDDLALAEEDLLSVLPSAERDGRMATLLDAATTIVPGDRLYRLLSSLPRPWSPDISRRIYTLLLEIVRRNDAQPWQWISFFERTSRLIDPTLHHNASERMIAIGSELPQWSNVLDKFVGTVRFRCEIIEALS